MTPCPHCRLATISDRAKARSSRETPTECAKCGGLSHVITSTGSGIPMATLLILLVGAVAGAGSGSWLWAFPAIAAAVTYNRWAWRRAELFPIFPRNAANARRANWAVTLAWIASFFAS
ncbi:hypothetical protein FN976_14185 [Caenimonas sedimenti]|uniref:Uncharacterized protein n=1 Tax=Caenimonas sedimenti TaxID=2596921 RepID=A0A562ZQS5_9BURK|nr:hypothetical protein [Caenimonas sedimenti]TWO70701.1 hypothetical protein FN976_14185 [Caenimonas sedimenti]